MKNKIYLVLTSIIFFHFINYGQNENKVKIIDDGYTKIPNTNIYAKIPENFKIRDKNVTMIKKDKNTYILFIKKKQNYFNQAKVFDYSIFENNKSKVIEHYDLKINGYPAKYIGVIKNGMKMNMFIFGNEKFFITVVAMNEAGDNENEKIIKNIIFNLKYVD